MTSLYWKILIELSHWVFNLEGEDTVVWLEWRQMKTTQFIYKDNKVSNMKTITNYLAILQVKFTGNF